jgi:hypothetical protein
VSPGPIYAACTLPAPIVGTDKPLLVVFEADKAALWQGMQDRAAALVIADAETFKAGNALLIEVAAQVKDIEARKAVLKRPVIDLGKAIDAVVANALTPLDTLKRSLSGKVVAFQTEQNRLAKEAADKAAAEARAAAELAEKERARLQAIADAEHAAKVAEAQAKAKAEADELAKMLGTDVEPEAVTVAPAPVVVVAKPAPVAVAPAPVLASAVQVRDVPVHVVVDPAALAAFVCAQGMPELVSFDMPAIKRHLAAGISFPGIEVQIRKDNVMARGAK